MHTLTIRIEDRHQMDSVWQAFAQSFGGRLIHTIEIEQNGDSDYSIMVKGSLDCCEELEIELKILGFWDLTIN